MSQFVSILFLVFLLKLLAISLSAFLIRKKCTDILSSLLGGWLLCQYFLISWMLLVSGFNHLSPMSLWIGLGLLNFILFVLAHREQKSFATHFLAYQPFQSISNGVSLLIILVIFLFITYRSFYFYDNTIDALTYGLARLDFYEQAKSLFVIQPTQAFNIFSNEWNGELNALFYMLATANEQASSFGNVEIWLLGFVTLSWLSGFFGFPPRTQCLIGLLLSTVPVLLGLSLTIKGDLLCIISFAMAYGFTLLMLRNPHASRWNLVFLFAALGMASGAKIIVLPYVGLIVLLTSTRHKHT